MKNTTPALQWSASKSVLPSIATGSLTVLSLGLSSTLVPADEDLGCLPDTTVIANRTATPLDKVGSSVSVLDVGALDQQGVRNLDDALKFVPGAISESLGGQRGSSSSLFIRGTKTNAAHLVVDGMRISDSNMTFGGFLGSSNIIGLSRIEVLRGPQGALYGGESIGGVVGIYSQKGEGDFNGKLRVEGGSFDTWNSMLALQGESGDFAYSLSLGHESTDNDLPNNAFEMLSYTLRLDYAVNPCLHIGITLRGADTTFEAPAYGGTYSSPLDDELSYTLATVFADYDVNEIWNTKVTIGIYDQQYHSQSPVYGFNPASTYDTD
ncbi:MAG: TonB-dependent receptor plug domain-containing protein, partial [Verrucomicrobiae bacterium]|nr:TonB-dependent receptor plug domain-containing protein [Verrucomicrobiae bacterium]NNJ86973.1 TonB-dependent receptor [Akkermansiaceae bacterium]